MKRQALLKIFLIVCVLVAVFVITGCIDKGLLDENYVEVESLRVDDATIYLSPSGETARYQLKVERLPTNATNTNLTYFIPSQYLEYVTVDSNGLITATKEPEESIRIPLTVTSTSNKNATLVLGLFVEYAEVESIEFLANNLELDYRSQPIQLGIKYHPYHAQDGRNITYSSLDASVASVNATGLVTPLKPGHFTIVAVSRTMSGKERTTHFHARIKYAKSRYNLDVSDVAPKYKQTIGQAAQPITFTLSSLEPHADPNPRIQWYVSGERMTDMDNKWQYPHTPSLSTVGSYNVEVKVLCEGEDEQTFVSQRIYIYNAFSGFDFVSAHQSKSVDNYLYGETVTFEITATGHGVDHFKWYLKRIGQQDQGVLVGQTVGTSPHLSRRLNLDGDYELNAIGCNAQGDKIEGQEHNFKFNVNRFVQDDTVIITPQVLNDGLPPESYNWYLYSCNESGEITSPAQPLNASHPNVVIAGHTLYYKLTQSMEETIIISAKGVLEGKVAKVGEQDFMYQTKPIKIHAKAGGSLALYTHDIVDGDDARHAQYVARTDTTITDLIIDGVAQDDGYKPLVYWSAVSKTAVYVVEITKQNGQVLLLDSTDYAGFGYNYCTMPSFVTLKDKFSVRVKQKGGQYTPYYYYGYDVPVGADSAYYFDTIGENHYGFLQPFTNVVDNGYIRSIKELGAILDYIILYEPGVSQNSLVAVTYGVSVQVDEKVENYDRKYAFKIYLELDFNDYAVYYPISINTDGLEDIYVDLYLSLQAAQNAYCETGDMRVNMNYDINDGGYYIHLYKNLNSINLIPPQTPGQESTQETGHYSQTPYGNKNGIFAINNKVSSQVWSTDQLYTVAENGRQPVPQTDVTSQVYNAAKSVVNKIIGKEMTDLEKVLAFYDWLILNVEYDYDALDTINISNQDAYKYQAFHLEGVFLSNKAVCDGLAKAMSLLCWIEDIPCYKVSGYLPNATGGIGHAWNKVYVDGNWYVLDTTWGGTTIKGIINYKFFLMTDNEFLSYYSFHSSPPIVFGKYQNATSFYNYYEHTYINGYDTYISSIEELATLLNSFGLEITQNISVQVKLAESLRLQYDLTTILGSVKTMLDGNKTLADTAEHYNNSIIIITLEPTD